MTTPFFLDVTGILRHGLQHPLGIPRVETGLARELLRDPRIVPVWYDQAAGCFARLDRQERQYLHELIDAAGAGSGAALDADHQPSSAILRLRLDRRSFRIALVERWVGPAPVSLPAKMLRRTIHIAVNIAHFLLKTWRMVRLRGPFISSRLGGRLSDASIPILLAEYNARRLPMLQMPCVRLIHDIIPVDFPDYFRAGNAEQFESNLRLTADRCARLIVVSEATRERLTHWLASAGTAQPPVSVATLPGFLHARHKPQSADRLAALGITAPYILYCATIETRKNHVMLLEAYTRLLNDCRQSGRDPPHLILVGKWGWLVEGVKTRLRADAALKDHVRVMNEVSDADLCTLYRHAAFCVYPSLVEGWGLGVSESLDFGTPVLVSTAASLCEASQGLMPRLEPHDVTAWYEAMRLYAFDPAARETLRQAAARYRRKPVADFAAEILQVLDLTATEAQMKKGQDVSHPHGHQTTISPQ